MDYAELRAEGIRHLEAMTGGRWTDFNAHDPGITILEQLCYTLTDLSYRIAHEVPDLLAADGASPYESLFGPSEILPSRPVTVEDLRRAVLDVRGVRNAWVEVAQEGEIPLHYHPAEGELSSRPDPPASESVHLRGLSRVLVEISDLAGLDGAEVRAAVSRRLHANRGLCEDFTQIRVLDPQEIRIEARIEVGAVEDAETVLLGIYEAIADQISPPIPFAGLEDLLEAGRSADEIYDGPLLERGFLEGVDETSSESERRPERLQTSDLIHAITGVPGVRAVRSLRLATGGEEAGPAPGSESGVAGTWSLDLDPERAPSLDLGGSEIVLQRAEIPIPVDAGRVREAYAERRRSDALGPGSGGDVASLRSPKGRDRSVGAYSSFQQHFPALYGIAEMGLAESAPPRRRAQARQLTAYLTFFDQLLAGSFAQLEHARDLFSFRGEEERTYFTQALDDPTLGLGGVLVRDEGDYRQRLAEIAEDAETPGALERRNRFLNHLLARFGESFAEYSLLLFEGEGAAQRLARAKEALLRAYPRLSAARGTGFDLLEPAGPDNASGLEQRLRLALALDPGASEELIVVEHILLRPTREDEAQQAPLLAASPYKDPYSLQLSVVFPAAAGRFRDEGFRRLAEQVLREETPAHLIPYVHWLEPTAWEAFIEAHGEWLRRRREQSRREAGLPVEVVS